LICGIFPKNLRKTFFTIRHGGSLKKVSRAKPAYRRQAAKEGLKYADLILNHLVEPMI
jgi:hypothetical protein